MQHEQTHAIRAGTRACYEEMHAQILKAKGDVFIQMNSMFYAWIFMEKGIMTDHEEGFFHAKMLGCSVRSCGEYTPYLYSVIDLGECWK